MGVKGGQAQPSRKAGPAEANGDGQQQPQRSKPSTAFGTTGYAHASLFGLVTYTFVHPLLRLGAAGVSRRPAPPPPVPLPPALQAIVAAGCRPAPTCDTLRSRPPPCRPRRRLRSPRRTPTCLPGTLRRHWPRASTPPLHALRPRRPPGPAPPPWSGAPGGACTAAAWRCSSSGRRWNARVGAGRWGSRGGPWPLGRLRCRREAMHSPTRPPFPLLPPAPPPPPVGVGSPVIMRQLLNWLNGWQYSGGDAGGAGRGGAAARCARASAALATPAAPGCVGACL